MVERDLPAADRVIRVAFGTFLGMPEPERFMGDAAYASTRWKADPSAALVAEHEGKLIGSNFLANWGSFGFFGPLTIEPKYWNSGVAQQLLAPTMEIFRRWGNRHLGLYTFANSPKHMALYQKFGFWPRDIVVLLTKDVAKENVAKDVAKADAAKAGPAERGAAKKGVVQTVSESKPVPAFPSNAALFSVAKPEERAHLLAACSEVTDKIFNGLDVTLEIRSVADQYLGDTILLWDGSKLAALAVCHVGPGTEAGSGVCYVKFAAVRPGPRSGLNFDRLLQAVEACARWSGAEKISAGVNVARREAFQTTIARGFRAESQGVAMEMGGASSGYNRAGVYILDDWR
jgi:GNAT superfamily N-acetyltransferase